MFPNSVARGTIAENTLTAAIRAGAALVAVVLYFVYRHSAQLMARLGEVGLLVTMRLLAFILLCVGLQIMWDGWAQLNRLAP